MEENMNSSNDDGGDSSQTMPYKEAFLEKNYIEFINLLNNKITPSSEELLFILSHNHHLADYIALKNIKDLKSYLNISA
jgi:hypothetical protein